jgi:hypothetical protein
VTYADPTAYEKAATIFAQDAEYQRVVIDISKIAIRVSRELVSDLDI